MTNEPLTKKQFALDWLTTVKAEIYKREFIIDLCKSRPDDFQEVNVDALTANNTKDKITAEFLENWLKEN
jgi:hypothetical protein